MRLDTLSGCGMLSPQLIWSVLESAPDAIVICDASGRIVFVNSQVTVLFGYEEHEILGHLVEQLLPERYRARHRDHRQAYTRALRESHRGRSPAAATCAYGLASQADGDFSVSTG